MFTPPPLPRNLEASFRDLSSQNPATRASAVRDVVRHALRNDAARERAIPLFERALKDDASPAVRAEAAVALADTSAREALAGLLFAVEDDDAHVRQMAISALGEIGDVRALPRLGRALRDARPEVRYQAVIAHVRVSKADTDATGAVIYDALADGDASIRYIALRLAEEACDGAGPSPRHPELRSRAEALLEDADDAVAVAAALYTAKLGSPHGRRAVLEVVAERQKTPEIEDEQACIELAAALGLSEAVESLENRVWGSRRFLRSVLSWGAGDRASCAWHAKVALARMGHARAKSEILAGLRSWRRETREAATVASGRARIVEARSTLEGLGSSVDPGLLRAALEALEVDAPTADS